LEKYARLTEKSDKDIIWARGNLDQIVVDCTEEKLEREHIWPFNRWRDVRTAVDLMYGTTNGYCKVKYEGFDSSLHITKHNPIDDALLDAMMLMYGESEI
jgi:hypothetical protein